ncbi:MULTISPECIES: FecCD family ABC transporter permease [Gordonia]|jgi:iron complex transport system permease protein|uniref:FecCD family ABC transporter permease n=1 Tax=Gordonia TaxID=2053 RepID=UPI003018F5DE
MTGMRDGTVITLGARGRLSMLIARRTLVVLGLMGVASAVLAVVALGIGDYEIAPHDVIGVMTGQNVSFDRVVVLEWRMPRIVTALLLGAGLGMSGAIFQALTGNALGSPDIVGFSFGAYTGALVVIGVIGGGYYMVAGGAFVGGLAVAAVVYLLSRKDGAVSGFRMIVVGIAVSAVMASFNQWIIMRIDLHRAMAAAVWAQGTLNGIDWTVAVPVLVCTSVLALLLATLGRSLAMLQLGDDLAMSLGVQVERTRGAYFVLGVAMVALAAAAAGPISFVALAAPQIARRLTGGAGVGLVSSAVTGAFVLLVSDVIAIAAFSPDEIPVGAVTVCIGGAYLVYLLVSQARRAR